MSPVPTAGLAFDGSSFPAAEASGVSTAARFAMVCWRYSTDRQRSLTVSLSNRLGNEQINDAYLQLKCNCGDAAILFGELICGGLARVIEFGNATRSTMSEVIAVLAEKFFLVLETLLSHVSDGQPAIVVSTTAHIPIKFPVSPPLAVALELGDDGRISTPVLAP